METDLVYTQDNAYVFNESVEATVSLLLFLLASCQVREFFSGL